MMNLRLLLLIKQALQCAQLRSGERFREWAFLEKKIYTAQEQNRPDVVEKRTHTVEKVMPIVPAERTFFLDETGTQLNMTRPTAWGPKSERVQGIMPAQRGENISLIAAITLEGIVAETCFTGTLNGVRFSEWVQHDLVPHLQPGDVVVLDNASPHANGNALDAIEKAGAYIFFLPPYSPDMNPIEEAWSKVKAYLRGAEARTKSTLINAIKEALNTITHQDILGWFGHAGWTNTYTA